MAFEALGLGVCGLESKDVHTEAKTLMTSLGVTNIHGLRNGKPQQQCGLGVRLKLQSCRGNPACYQASKLRL